MDFDVWPQMTYRDPKEHLEPLFGTFPYSHMGAAGYSRFWEYFVAPKLKEIAKF